MRVWDRLLDKKVKCPDCETAFLAQPIEESPSKSPARGATPVPSSREQTRLPPVVPPVNPGPAVQSFVLAESASSHPPSLPGAATPRSGEREPFETPALTVFAVIAGVLVSAALVGFGFGCWIGAAVER